MRLTLRTLLAYLDDTLPPNEIKAIGQKVAESDTAQELIERIKQVTRRRRLTTPPTNGPGALDANTVAEYLDSELSSEQVAELEKLAIESDVHLAEIAASHQILTLVLGEPAQVPPTARERMYALVQGRESLTSRKAPRPLSAAGEPDQEADEHLLPGLSVFHQAPWLRWALPLAGLVLLLLIAIPLLLDLMRPSGVTGNGKVAQATETRSDTSRTTDSGVRETKPTESKPVETKTTENKIPENTNPENKNPENKNPETEGPRDPARLSTIPPPSNDRKVVGRYHPYQRLPSILVARKGPNDWERLVDGGDVNSMDQLVSLPDFISAIDFPRGGQLLLRGQIPEIAQVPLMEKLLESAVTLHTSPKFDIDLSLQRGRLFLSNTREKGPLHVCLRLTNNEAWDMTLNEPETEVGVEMYRVYPRGTINWKDEDPYIQVILIVLKGNLSLKVDASVFHNMEPAGVNLFIWNNKTGFSQPTSMPEKTATSLRALWEKQLPSRSRELENAPEGLSALMGQKKPGPALSEALGSDSRGKRFLAIDALGALDLLPKLIDVLNDGDEAHDPERALAVYVLHQWLTRGPEASKQLAAEFVQKGFTPQEATNAVSLLHDLPDDAARKPETFDYLLLYMSDRSRVALRELGWRQMQRLAQPLDAREQAVKLPQFNTAWGEEQRKRALEDIRKLLAEGKLPPGQAQPPMQPPMPMRP
jgi:hypothetical protein